jgi:hypothetical protein
MPLVNSEKNAQIGKVLKEVDTTSEIYQLVESDFNASTRKLHQFSILNLGLKEKSKIPSSSPNNRWRYQGEILQLQQLNGINNYVEF